MGPKEREIKLFADCSSGTGTVVASDDNSGPDGVSSYIKWTAAEDSAMQVLIFDASTYYYDPRGYDIRVTEFVPLPNALFNDGFEDEDP